MSLETSLSFQNTKLTPPKILQAHLKIKIEMANLNQNPSWYLIFQKRHFVAKCLWDWDKVRQDRKPIRNVCISVLAAAQLRLTCLISQVFKSLSMPSPAHSATISLIKVQVTIPVQIQVGHTAFMLCLAHYSDTLPAPPRLKAEHNARQHQPGDLGTLNL